MTEDAIHMQLVAELRYAGLGPEDFFHCPNGGRCSKPEAARRKRRGVSAGVPDLVFTRPPPNFPDVLIAALEVKTEKGRLSGAQKEWIKAQRERGWMITVGKGLEGCRTILRGLGYLPTPLGSTGSL